MTLQHGHGALNAPPPPKPRPPMKLHGSQRGQGTPLPLASHSTDRAFRDRPSPCSTARTAWARGSTASSTRAKRAVLQLMCAEFRAAVAVVPLSDMPVDTRILKNAAVGGGLHARGEAILSVLKQRELLAQYSRDLIGADSEGNDALAGTLLARSRAVIASSRVAIVDARHDGVRGHHGRRVCPPHGNSRALHDSLQSGGHHGRRLRPL